MTNIWMDEKEEAFVDLIEENPVLYNAAHKSYSNRNVKSNAWRDIEERLGINEKELKKRWESLRTQYNRYIRMTPTASGGAPRTARQEWVLQRLKFLDPHLKRNSPSTVDYQETMGDVVQEDLEMVVEQSTSSSSPFNGPEDAESGTEGIRAANTPKRASTPKRKLKKKASPEEAASGQGTRLIQDLSNTLQAMRKEDGISIFCKFIDSRMRLIDSHEDLMKVQDTIQQTFIQLLSEQRSALTPAHAAFSPPSLLHGPFRPVCEKKPFSAVEECSPLAPVLPTPSSQMDEDELFFKTLMHPLKRLPPPKKAAVKLKIHQLLYDAEFN